MLFFCGLIAFICGFVNGSTLLMGLGGAFMGPPMVRNGTMGYTSGYRAPSKRILIIPDELRNDYGKFFHDQAVLCDAHLVFGYVPATAVMHANGYYVYVPTPKPPTGPASISPPDTSWLRTERI